MVPPPSTPSLSPPSAARPLPPATTGRQPAGLERTLPRALPLFLSPSNSSRAAYFASRNSRASASGRSFGGWRLEAGGLGGRVAGIPKISLDRPSPRLSQRFMRRGGLCWHGNPGGSAEYSHELSVVVDGHPDGGGGGWEPGHCHHGAEDDDHEASARIKPELLHRKDEA